jgi:hypothetical protein
MSSNADKIAELRAEADKLEAAEKAFKALPADEQLAITLHSLLCHWNHTDGCSWEYEGSGGKTDWNGYAHKEYLTKGRKMLAFCQCKGISSKDAVKILQIAKEF